ncbi:hypothetical protein ACFL59_03355 [Planctomycetota bacterium]
MIEPEPRTVLAASQPDAPASGPRSSKRLLEAAEQIENCTRSKPCNYTLCRLCGPRRGVRKAEKLLVETEQRLLTFRLDHPKVRFTHLNLSTLPTPGRKLVETIDRIGDAWLALCELRIPDVRWGKDEQTDKFYAYCADCGHGFADRKVFDKRVVTCPGCGQKIGKREKVKELILGGFLSIEIEMTNSRKYPDHFNVHAHLPIFADYLPVRWVAWKWKRMTGATNVKLTGRVPGETSLKTLQRIVRYALKRDLPDGVGLRARPRAAQPGLYGGPGCAPPARRAAARSQIRLAPHERTLGGRSAPRTGAARQDPGHETGACPMLPGNPPRNSDRNLQWSG